MGAHHLDERIKPPSSARYACRVSAPSRRSACIRCSQGRSSNSSIVTCRRTASVSWRAVPSQRRHLPPRPRARNGRPGCAHRPRADLPTSDALGVRAGPWPAARTLLLARAALYNWLVKDLRRAISHHDARHVGLRGRPAIPDWAAVSFGEASTATTQSRLSWQVGDGRHAVSVHNRTICA